MDDVAVPSAKGLPQNLLFTYLNSESAVIFANIATSVSTEFCYGDEKLQNCKVNLIPQSFRDHTSLCKRHGNGLICVQLQL